MQNPGFVDQSLRNEDWLGVVVNTADTTFSGRAQVRVFGLLNEIRDDHLPWATPINSLVFAGNGSGSLSVPKVGQFVRVLFNNGDLYAPEYTAIQNVDTALIQKIKDDYPGTHVLLYDPDEDLNIIYQNESGLTIYHKEAVFQINKDSEVTINTPNNDALVQLVKEKATVFAKDSVTVAAGQTSIITADEVRVEGNQNTLVGPNAINHAVLAEPMWAILSSMAAALDAKLPPTPGVNVALVESMKQAATSMNVLIGK
jgi:hypothetical protein